MILSYPIPMKLITTWQIKLLPDGRLRKIMILIFIFFYQHAIKD